jgi:hypothetical protein
VVETLKVVARNHAKLSANRFLEWLAMEANIARQGNHE